MLQTITDPVHQSRAVSTPGSVVHKLALYRDISVNIKVHLYCRSLATPRIGVQMSTSDSALLRLLGGSFGTLDATCNFTVITDVHRLSTRVCVLFTHLDRVLLTLRDRVLRTLRFAYFSH